MRKRLIHFTLGAALLFGGVTDVSAHSGRTDELGGHFYRQNCTYHFHHPTNLTKNKSRAQIINLIKKNNSNNKCTRQLTEKKVDWRSLGR
ncbi:hypothetical protein [Anoxybacteroides tepidamans]|uniref:hypothetical protein n=1 Tax=Anoxybacteroides tepidamans TaxID=265948 RepID=UPI0004819A81|nr:hypothetical protein [Anoxybacillus tepidamans]